MEITFLCEEIAFHIFWIELCDFCQDSDPFSGTASTKAGNSEASCFCYKYSMQNILKFQVGFSFCPASRKSSCLKRKTRELTKNYMSVCWEIHPRVSTIYTNTVFTLDNSSLLKWQVRKYINLVPWSKFTRLYVLSISIVLLVPGHMEVIGLGGMGCWWPIFGLLGATCCWASSLTYWPWKCDICV